MFFPNSPSSIREVAQKFGIIAASGERHNVPIVSIPSFTPFNFDGDSFYAFKIVVDLGQANSYPGGTRRHEFLRRYSDFRRLDDDIEKLLDTAPSENRVFLPNRFWFGNRDEKKIEGRRKALEKYLQWVVSVLNPPPPRLVAFLSPDLADSTLDRPGSYVGRNGRKLFRHGISDPPDAPSIFSFEGKGNQKRTPPPVPSRSLKPNRKRNISEKTDDDNVTRGTSCRVGSQDIAVEDRYFPYTYGTAFPPPFELLSAGRGENVAGIPTDVGVARARAASWLQGRTKLRLWIGTWNTGCRCPTSESFSPWLPEEGGWSVSSQSRLSRRFRKRKEKARGFDIVVLGLQETERRNHQDAVFAAAKRIGDKFTLVRSAAQLKVCISIFVRNELVPVIAPAGLHGFGFSLTRHRFDSALNKAAAVATLHFLPVPRVERVEIEKVEKKKSEKKKEQDGWFSRLLFGWVDKVGEEEEEKPEPVTLVEPEDLPPLQLPSLCFLDLHLAAHEGRKLDRIKQSEEVLGTAVQLLAKQRVKQFVKANLINGQTDLSPVPSRSSKVCTNDLQMKRNSGDANSRNEVHSSGRSMFNKVAVAASNAATRRWAVRRMTAVARSRASEVAGSERKSTAADGISREEHETAILSLIQLKNQFDHVFILGDLNHRIDLSLAKKCNVPSVV